MSIIMQILLITCLSCGAAIGVIILGLRKPK